MDQKRVSATQYQYAVRAYRKENGKEVYSQYNAVLGATRPEMPKIQAKANSSRQITVSWNHVSRADGYSVYRKASGEKWKTMITLSKDHSSYVDKTVLPDTKYVYTVRPYKLGGGNVKYLASYKINNKVIESNLVTTPGKEYPAYNSAQKEVMKKFFMVWRQVEMFMGIRTIQM